MTPMILRTSLRTTLLVISTAFTGITLAILYDMAVYDDFAKWPILAFIGLAALLFAKMGRVQIVIENEHFVYVSPFFRYSKRLYDIIELRVKWIIPGKGKLEVLDANRSASRPLSIELTFFRPSDFAKLVKAVQAANPSVRVDDYLRQLVQNTYQQRDWSLLLKQYLVGMIFFLAIPSMIFLARAVAKFFATR